MTIEARHISYRVRDRSILQDVELTADDGELLIIVGPNGAGKSTLLRVLAGDLHPFEGTVIVDGLSISDRSTADLALVRSYLGPRPLEDVEFSTRDVVTMGRHPHWRLHATTAAGDEVIVHEAMLATDVDSLADQPISELSSGEAQRVGVARCLAQETPIVLLDEPTSSLDIGHQAQVMAALRERALDGTAIVAVVHDLNLAARFADRLVLMSNGAVAAEGAPDEVLDGKVLTAVYAYPISVVPNPLTGDPLVVPSR